MEESTTGNFDPLFVMLLFRYIDQLYNGIEIMRLDYYTSKKNRSHLILAA
jgi:hypothetical protein